MNALKTNRFWYEKGSERTGNALKSNRFWYVVFFAIICICFIFIYFMKSVPASNVLVIQDGMIIETISMSRSDEEFIYVFESDDFFNIISIKNGSVSISEANCPDKLCVKQGRISTGVLVCLPHKLVITLSGSTPSQPDAVSR